MLSIFILYDTHTHLDSITQVLIQMLDIQQTYIHRYIYNTFSHRFMVSSVSNLHIWFTFSIEESQSKNLKTDMTAKTNRTIR